MIYHFGSKVFRLFLVFILIGWTLFSCNDENTKSSGEMEEAINEPDMEKGSQASKKEIVMPSPIEIAQIIENTGISYTEGIINPVSSAANYNTTYSKGLNLGVYGADLGLIIAFGQTQEALNYFKTVKDLSKELDIYGIVGQKTVDRIENNLDRKDTLLTIVTNTFQKADIDLKGSKRDAVSALVLAGGWVEALYLASQFSDREANNEINNRIGEQKLSLETLIELLTMYKDDQDENYIALIDDLKDLKLTFDKVTISIEKSEPVTKKDSKITIINSTSNVTIGGDAIAEITEKVTKIRQKIVS